MAIPIGGLQSSLQEQGYRPRADIRMIVHELISKSGIKPHELKRRGYDLYSCYGGFRMKECIIETAKVLCSKCGIRYGFDVQDATRRL